MTSTVVNNEEVTVNIIYVYEGDVAVNIESGDVSWVPLKVTIAQPGYSTVTKNSVAELL